MNAVTPYEPQHQGGSFALVPQTLSEAMQLAKMMAENGVLPELFRNKPAHCLQIIEQAGRWRMSPFQVAMGTSLINGKLMTEGKVIAAAVNTQPCMAERLNYRYAGEGDNRSVTVFGTLRGESEPREVEVKLKDAKTTNKMWQTQADQQLAYSGARVWARRHTPEVIMGVYAPEEFDGPTIDHHPEPTRQPAPATTLTTGDAMPDEPPPPPDPVVTLKQKLARCETTDDVTRVRTVWNAAVAKADAAGRGFADTLLRVADQMIAERDAALVPTADAPTDDLADAL